MNWKAMAAALAAVGFILLLAFGMTRDPRAMPSALVGQPAPDFTLQTLAGDTFRLSSLAGTPRMVNFWATWCIPCQDEHPLLIQVSNRYRGELEVIGVVYQDTRRNVERRYRQRGGEWTNVMDPGSRTAIEYGVFGVPETFFITREGTIAHRSYVLYPDSMAIWLGKILTGTAGNDTTLSRR
jgi:cytochrome c biogenesis protein CcmG/thiol:disulfide interchange protein DsbE